MGGSIDPAVWRVHAWRNRLQAVLLLGVMGTFLALLGVLIWGRDGLVVLVSAGVVGAVLNPAFSPWLIMRLYGARPLPPDEAPGLWRALRELAARADLSRPPTLFYVPSPMLNAFAVGSRDNSAVAVTAGLLQHLDGRELLGVLAHEVSHIRSNDLWVMGLADLFSRLTSVLSLMGQFLLLVNLPLLMVSEVTISWWVILLLVFAPTLSALVQLALSRNREFDADLNAARLTGDVDGLARALAKIERVQGGWLERLFLPGRRLPEPSLLRTHPDTEERIRRLMALKPQIPAASPWPTEARPEIPTALGIAQPDRGRPRWHWSGLWY